MKSERAGHIITIANHKGGVGKTTSVINIAYAMKRKGYTVLVIDTDAQQNLTYLLTGETGSQWRTIYDALTGKTKGSLPIIFTKTGIDLVPADVQLSRVEIDLAGKLHRREMLKNLLCPVLSRYDYILIDTPPSLGVLMINAITAADDLYIPLTAEGLPLQGLDLMEELTEVTAGETGAKGITGIFFTRYNRRSLNNAVIDIVRGRYGELLFDTRIRENIAIAEAPFTGEMLLDRSPTSNGAKDYEALTNEIIQRIKNKK